MCTATWDLIMIIIAICRVVASPPQSRGNNMAPLNANDIYYQLMCTTLNNNDNHLGCRDDANDSLMANDNHYPWPGRGQIE